MTCGNPIKEKKIFIPKYKYLYLELKTFSYLSFHKDYKLTMDKEHLIDLISNSMIFEIKDLESNENKFNTTNYLNNLNINQLRIISKEFIL